MRVGFFPDLYTHFHCVAIFHFSQNATENVDHIVNHKGLDLKSELNKWKSRHSFIIIPRIKIGIRFPEKFTPPLHLFPSRLEYLCDGTPWPTGRNWIAEKYASYQTTIE